MRWWLALSSFLLCSCVSPSPDAELPAPREAAQGEPAQAAVTIEDLAHSDDPRVLTSFPRARQELFLHAQKLELLGIICEREPDEGEATLREFYPIRSRVNLDTLTLRTKVLGALFAGISAGGGVAFCFDPHHAIVATHEGQRYEVVICYACSQVKVWHGQNMLSSASIGARGSELLNEVLGQDANIPSSEFEGRSLAYWINALRAGLGKAESGERFEEACEVINGLLTERPLKAAALTEVIACLRTRFAHHPSEVIFVLSNAMANASHLPARLAAITLLGELSRKKPRDEALAEELSARGYDLLEVLAQELPTAPDSNVVFASNEAPLSPEIYRAASEALAALRWAERDVIADWFERARGEEPEARKRMLAALQSMQK